MRSLLHVGQRRKLDYARFYALSTNPLACRILQSLVKDNRARAQSSTPEDARFAFKTGKRNGSEVVVELHMPKYLQEVSSGSVNIPPKAHVKRIDSTNRELRRNKYLIVDEDRFYFVTVRLPLYESVFFMPATRVQHK